MLSSIYIVIISIITSTSRSSFFKDGLFFLSFLPLLSIQLFRCMGLSGELCASPHPCGMTLDFGRAGWEGRRAHQAAGWKMFDALGVRVYVYEYVCMYVCMFI